MTLVEIARGGSDYSGADALTLRSRRLGEGATFGLCLEAVAAAIALRDAWNRDDPKAGAVIGIGATGGGRAEIAPYGGTDAELKAEATAKDDKLPTCDQCGKPITGQRWTNPEYDAEFCSQFCAEPYDVAALDEEVEEDDELDAARDWEGSWPRPSPAPGPL